MTQQHQDLMAAAAVTHTQDAQRFLKSQAGKRLERRRRELLAHKARPLGMSELAKDEFNTLHRAIQRLTMLASTTPATLSTQS